MGLTHNPVLGINLRKNTNSNSTGFGKYYPLIDRQKTLTTRGFAEHMIAHGTKYQLEDIQAILRMFAACLPELLAMGIGVKFDGLGIFKPYPQVKNPVPSIAAMKGLNPRDVVKAVHIRFEPDTTKLDDLSGPKYADRCAMELRNIIEIEQVKENGKVVERLKTLIPIETALYNLENGSGNTSGGGTSQGGGNTGGGSTQGGDNTGGNGGTSQGGTTGGDDNGGGGDNGSGLDMG